MDTAIRGGKLVPYGVDTWSPASLAVRGVTPRGLVIDGDFPFAVVDDPGRGLRLNSAPFDGKATAAADIFQGLRDRIAEACSPWDAVGRRAIARYFDWIEETVAAHRDILEARLAPYEGLFRPSDFRFSAPRPLPRAHLHASGERGPRGSR